MKATSPPKCLAKPAGIRSGEFLTSSKFQEQMGWGRKAFVAARNRGLPVHKVSRRVYVSTDEAIEWLRKQRVAK